MKTVIAGSGELAVLFAKELFANHEVVVIVPDPTRAREFEELDVQVVGGLPTDLAVLKAAGTEDADFFIACCDSDETNIIGCLAAKRLGKLVTFCLVNKHHYFETFLGELGKDLVIDHLIWPERVLAEAIARTIIVPDFGENELRNRDVRDLDPRRRRAEGHDGSVCCPSGGRARKNRKSSAVQGKNLPTEIEKPEGQIDEGLEQLEAKLFLPKKGDGTLRKRARRGGFAFVASPDTPASCRQSVVLSGLAHP